MADPLAPLGQPGVAGLGRTFRRWGALLALAGVALPGVRAGRASDDSRPAAGSPGAAAVAQAQDHQAPPTAPAPLLPENGWEAALVEPAFPAPPAPTTTTGPATAPPAEQARAIPAGGEPSGAGLVPLSRQHLSRWLVRYAEENGLPTDLIMAQAWKESSWRAGAVSEDGAAGVMQLMPATVDYVSRKLLGLTRTLDPFDPAANIRMGTRYMRHLVDRFDGDYRRALMAYNQGVTSLLANGPYGEARAYADAVYALRSTFQPS